MSLDELLNSLIQRYKRYFIQHRVYPNKQVPAEDAVIYSDRKWLRFSIGQVITNAVKYSSGRSERIDLTIFRKGERIILEIKDYGIGIPSQDVKRVFEPYYTGENGRRFQESTGIGLYLVKEIAEKLNHDVSIDSEEGKETTVQFSFLTKCKSSLIKPHSSSPSSLI